MIPPTAATADVDPPQPASAAADDAAALVSWVGLAKGKGRPGRAGSRAAWARIYDRLAPVVHGVLLARGVRPTTDADDLVQEVFIHAMGRIGSLREDHAISPWLAAMARNAATDHARRTLRVSRGLKLVDGFVETREHGLERAKEKRQDAERVLEVIRSLPESYHETLVLRLVKGLTGPQIAMSLGMTHGSVRVNLVRGMEMLKKKLKSEPKS